MMYNSLPWRIAIPTEQFYERYLMARSLGIRLLFPISSLMISTQSHLKAMAENSRASEKHGGGSLPTTTIPSKANSVASTGSEALPGSHAPGSDSDSDSTTLNTANSRFIGPQELLSMILTPSASDRASLDYVQSTAWFKSIDVCHHHQPSLTHIHC